MLDESSMFNPPAGGYIAQGNVNLFTDFKHSIGVHEPFGV